MESAVGVCLFLQQPHIRLFVAHHAILKGWEIVEFNSIAVMLARIEESRESQTLSGLREEEDFLKEKPSNCENFAKKTVGHIYFGGGLFVKSKQ